MFKKVKIRSKILYGWNFRKIMKGTKTYKFGLRTNFWGR